ncbi:MAG TPA: DHA2 family efflux MFS transporter permease subunit [Rhizomicrobium sp.]
MTEPQSGTAPAGKTADDPGLPFKGGTLVIAIMILALANFMAVLDMTIVNVAVPHIAGALAVSQDEGTWVITSYSVAEAILVPLTGWLAARFGAVRVFVLAAIGFGIFSALCGIATSLQMLVVFRVMQGVCGGPLMPMSQTLLVRVAPPERRNLALGLWAMTTILAPVAGPLLGGIFADGVGWEWAFYINVPVAAFCALIAWRMLGKHEAALIKKPIDFMGLTLLVVWVGALQIMLDNGEDKDWFGSPFIVALFLTAVVGFIAFIIWELTETDPIVDLRVFRHRGFAVSALTMLLTYGSFFGSIVLVPLWLQTNMNYTATWAGYLVAFNGAFGIVMAPIAGSLMARVDGRILMSIGIAIISFATLLRVFFALDMSFAQLLPPQLTLGLGMPLFFVPMTSLALAAVRPEETASASGLINFLRTMSGAFATAIVTTAWQNGTRVARADTVGHLNNAVGMIQKMRATGLSAGQALQSLDNLVQRQSVMLSTNHIFLVVGLILAAASAAVWLMPKPAAQLRPVAGH